MTSANSMTAHAMRVRAWLLVAMIFWLHFSGHSAVAQENSEQPFREIGTKQCAFCHYDGGNPILNEFRATEFAHLNEIRQWSQVDPHVGAFKLIDPNGTGESNQLSRRICEKLKIDVPSFGDASNTKARDCLSCHAGWTNVDAPPPREELQFGVRCESCHGAASRWAELQNHQQPTWRAISPQEKLEKYGMRPLNQPLARAELCYSCHIGNLAENKFVTHAMYAAGHPPLPSIELQSHSHAMGKHWRTLSEKDPFEFYDEHVQANYPYLIDATGQARSPDDDLPELRMLLVGGAIAMKQTAAVLQALSKDTARAWPDFAAYDCTSCHHELQVDSNRQPVSIAGEPFIPRGRPLFSVWPTTNSRIAAGLLKSTEEADSNVLALRMALGEKPFGFRSKISAEDSPAAKLQSAFQDMAQQLSARRLTPQDGLDALRLLCAAPTDRELADYESARQRAWAIEVVSSELNGSLEFASDSDEFDAIIEELRSELWLRLPMDARVGRRQEQPGITLERQKRLDVAAKYSPARFKEQLKKLDTLLVH